MDLAEREQTLCAKHLSKTITDSTKSTAINTTILDNFQNEKLAIPLLYFSNDVTPQNQLLFFFSWLIKIHFQFRIFHTKIEAQRNIIA